MPLVLESLVRWSVLTAYFGTLLLLTGYGLHRWHLVRLYFRHRKDGLVRCPWKESRSS